MNVLSDKLTGASGKKLHKQDKVYILKMWC